MNELPYFAYGSNLLLARLRHATRCPGARRLGTADLGSHRLSFDKKSNLDGSGKCTIWPSNRMDDVVHGVLYALTSEDRVALDRVEGVGYGYEVVEVRVDTRTGPLAAFSYRAEAHWRERGLTPLGWYRDLVLAGAMENDLPATLIDWLAEQAVERDSDRNRSERERRVLPPLSPF